MENTVNYNLKKPEVTDPALITDINDNMDSLDTLITDISNTILTLVIANGKSGGQILIGGTGSGDNLDLKCTSHATGGITNIYGILNIGPHNAAKSVNSGIVTEVSSDLIEFGLNDGSTNRFGGAYDSTKQGGFLRFDARSTLNLMGVFSRAAGVSGAPVMIFTMLSSGYIGGVGVTTPTVGLELANSATSGDIKCHQLISQVAAGTAPIVVASNTVIPNLNASLLEGHAASYFGLASKEHTAGTDTGLDTGGTNPVTASQLNLILAKANRNTDQSISAATVTAIAYNNELADTHSAFNPATGVFTVPRAGYYRVTVFMRSEDVAWTARDEVSLGVLVDGSEAGKLDAEVLSASLTKMVMLGGTFVTDALAVGQTIQPCIYSARAIVIDGGGFAIQNTVIIERIPGA